MRPTPETDKFFATFADGEYAPSHAEYYARLQDLERERDEAREQRDRLAAELEQLIAYQPRSTVITTNERHVWSNAKDALQYLTTKP